MARTRTIWPARSRPLRICWQPGVTREPVGQPTSHDRLRDWLLIGAWTSLAVILAALVALAVLGREQ